MNDVFSTLSVADEVRNADDDELAIFSVNVSGSAGVSEADTIGGVWTRLKLFWRIVWVHHFNDGFLENSEEVLSEVSPIARDD